MDRDTLRLLKWISAGIEAFLGIPFLGGTVIIATGWAPLGIMFIFHILLVVFSNKAGEKAAGNIVGIITSVIGIIPILGMIMHLVTAAVIALEMAGQKNSRVG
ncbi:hypothetical protein [Pradoshia sp.]